MEREDQERERHSEQEEASTPKAFGYFGHFVLMLSPAWGVSHKPTPI